MTRRVVVTGCGVVSPIGSTKESVWESLCAGKSGVRKMSSLPTEALPVKSGGEVQEFTGHIRDFGELPADIKKTIRKGLKVMCREIKMGVAAAQLAMADARLGERVAERIGAVYGSDYIMTMPEEFTSGVAACLNDDNRFDFGVWAERGMPQVTPLWLLKYLPNMPACHVAIYNDLRGPNNSLTVREASSNLAIGEAFSTITRGAADQIVTGATGSRIHPLRTVHTILQEELATGDDDPASLSRPFDKSRRGMVVGEGAAALMLEEAEAASSRGADVMAEIKGYGSSSVLDRQGTPRRGQALVNAMRQALAMAQLSPDQIGHIHAHGLGTLQLDVEEAAAIREVFGAASKRVPVVAAKSYFGNLGAASGLVELIGSLMAMRAGHLFATLNLETLDPDCDGICVATDNAQPAGANVLNVNVTPQGQASSVIASLVT